ncbi:transposase [Candidatus Desulfosporosinus infrequens]|uniref:Transposase n=1 Tax=Candidatus Desulfosporosinus infrequens TaxID=2043169 RepID=A0A2U3KLM2_9FIRM|nr:transposase [Candidatus Desulfosporosinus infrequens]
MFLKKVTLKTEGKTYNYYKIVASYRDKDGKPKHRLIQNLGVLSDEDAARMKMILQVQQDSDLSLAKSSNIVVTKHWMFLPILLLHSLWEVFQLHRFFPDNLVTEAMVLNRCIEPRSKIHVMEWVQDTVLPAIHRSSTKSSNYAVYRELDDLNKRESALQAHLYQQLLKFDPSVGEGFFYDITSSYMEGSKCIIAKLGYSRDHRPDLQQIVIALMVTPLGSPFYWKVLEGNTQDVTTLPDVVKDLKNRFDLTRCHLVFDRGMVSDDHLNFLERQELTYLSAMDKDEMACHSLFNEFMPEPASKDDYEQILALHEFQPTDENQFFYTREGQIDQRRFIFSFDVTRFYEDVESREKRMTQAMAWITEKNASLAIAKKSRNKETIERDVKTMLAKRKLKLVLLVTVTPLELTVIKSNGKTRIVQSFQLTVEIDKNKEMQKRRLDGITCFITNDMTIPQGEVIQKYRDKNKIEEAFREMKSQLALRPIYLTRPERVKAHVTICIMAYLLINSIEMLLRKAEITTSSEELLRQLSSCRLNQVGLKNSPERTLTITEMTEQQKSWVKLFHLERMIKPKVIDQFNNFLL